MKEPDGWEPTVADMQRAFADVGRFMFNWAALESALNAFIGKGLTAEGLVQTVVTSNVQFRDKIHIAKALVSLQYKSAEWRKKTVDWIDKAREMSLDRNLVVHTFFAPTPTGLRFYVKRAKGVIDLEQVYWRASDLDAKIAKINRVVAGLRQAQDDLTPVAPTGALGGFAAWTVYGDLPPTERRGLLARALGEGRPTPKAQHFDPVPPMPEPESETPPSQPPTKKAKRPATKRAPRKKRSPTQTNR